VARIVKRRSLAKELCEKGAVKINGEIAKPSKQVSLGDVIEVDTLTKYLKVKVLKVPKGKNVSKKESRELVETLEEVKKDIRDIIDLI
jgi:ribosomal 50S subunit-recycling heat shock protein